MEDAPDWDDLLEDVMHQEEEEDPMRMDDDEYPDFNEDEYQAPVSTVQPPSTMDPIPDSRAPVATEEPSMDDDYEDDPPMSSPPRSPTFTPTERRPVRPSARKDVFAFERYTSDTVWRAEVLDSPQRAVLKAKGWKKKDPSTGLDATTNSSFSPEMHLVHHHHTHVDDIITTRAVLATPRYSVQRRRLQPGTSSRPMTVADGQQVSWNVRNGSESTLEKTNTNNNTAVFASDTSLQGVFARVQEARRRAATTTAQSSPQKRRPTRRSQYQQLWVQAHAPRSFGHLLSDDRTNRLVLQALRSWDAHVFHKSTARPDMDRRVLLISGPPGVGKTTLAHICAAHCGYRPLEVNGSDDRSKDVLMDRVTRAMESTTLSAFTGDGKSRPNCLILDEIDGADSSAAMQALVDLIKAEPSSSGGSSKKGSNNKQRSTPYLRRPIIFVCNNKYAPALRPLLPYAVHFQVEPPTPAKLVTRLRAVLQSEGLALRGGSSLLHQLVAVSGGDIRYCLMALQFAATKATPPLSGGVADISAPLFQSLRGGSSGKDTRSDVLSVLTAVFQKKRQASGGRKKTSPKSTSQQQEVLSSLVTSYGDNSKLLDLLFLNAMNVSFIDPTLDRCATLYEWLSHADTFRSSNSSVAMTNSSLHHALQNLYIPSAANALHCLCRVEQRQELTFSDRELYDVRFRQEAHQELAFRIAEGIVPSCKTARATSLMGIETASYVLWALSAGYGKCALDRAVTSVKLLKDGEQQAFTHHADVLRSLGLSYKTDPTDYTDPKNPPSEFRLKLEPPLQRFARYTNGHRSRRRPVPDMLKTLLAKAAAQAPAKAATSESPLSPGAPSSSSTPSLLGNKRKKDSPTSVLGDKVVTKSKKPKVVPYFWAPSSKKASSVTRGKQRAKVSHSGSGVPMSQVMRLKYTKGFTQAVRVPCRLDDLA